MSIRLVALVCLAVSAGFQPGAGAAEPASKEISGQWDLILKSGQQEVHGYMLLRQDGTEIQGGGRDHGEFLVQGSLDASKNPPRIQFARRYVINNEPSKDVVTFYGDLQFPKDGPHMSGVYTVPHKPGETEKLAVHDAWEATMLERLERGSTPTYVVAGDVILNGEVYLKEGSYRNAIRNFTEAIRMNPKDAVVYSYRATAYDKLGEHQKAIDDCTSAIGLNPEDAVAYVNRGNSRAKLKQYREAIADYTKAIDVDPDYAPAFRQRGASQFILEQNQKAIEDFSKAIALKPDDAQSHYFRGATHSKLGQHQAAIEDYSKAISFYPKDAQAYCGRGRAYSELRLEDNAIHDYTQAITYNPEDKIAYSERGAAYTRRAVSFRQAHNPIADAASAIQDYTKAMTQSQLLLLGALASVIGIAIVTLAVACRRLFAGRRAGTSK